MSSTNHEDRDNGMISINRDRDRDTAYKAHEQQQDCGSTANHEQRSIAMDRHIDREINKNQSINTTMDCNEVYRVDRVDPPEFTPELKS